MPATSERAAGRLRSAIVGALLVGLVANLATAADPRNPRFRHLTNDDGLSQSFVFAIAQDREGYMWFGTQEGLNRFDGHAFTVFTPTAGDPMSLSDESIRAIIQDRQGRLWIGTDAGGLSRYDRTQQTFTRYRHDASDPQSLVDDRVRVLFEDRSGNIWIGTDGAGLDRLDPETGRFVHFLHDPEQPASLSGSHVWSITQRADGSIWIGTDQGLSRLNADGRSFTNWRHDPDDSGSLSDSWVRALHEDDRGSLWVATNAGGISRLEADGRTFERFQHDPDDPRSLSDNRVNAILEDDTGTLWFGTARGLSVWNPESRDFSAFYHDGNDRYSLTHDTVLTLFQDRGNVLWVGTLHGLSRWNQATRAMLHYRADENDPQSLSENTVTSFAEAPNGDVWVGTFGGGLNRLDRDTNRFDVLRHDPNDESSLPSNHVMSLQADRSGDLWVGTRNSGISRLEAGTTRFQHYRQQADDPQGLSADGITDILEDSNGKIWIATFGGGVNRYEPETDSFIHIKHDPDDEQSLTSDRILLLFEDSEGAIWVGTYAAGLNRLDPLTGAITRVQADPERADGLGGDEIFMIEEDADGNLWVGVKGKGLYCWARADRARGITRFREFNEIHGLPSATVYSAIWDDAGYLWLSSGRGLSRFDVATLEFRNYTVGHGLQGPEFNFGAGLKAADGELFFGGTNGFNAFRPDDLLGSRVAPTAAITRMTSMNTPISVGGSSSDSVIELDHEQRMISFEFSALDYAAPEHNTFMYRLSGLEDDWIDAGTQRQVTYTNLRPGDYSFHVRARNNDGQWSERDAVLPLRLHPAPWLTPWAYTLYVIGFFGTTFVWLRAHRRQLALERQYTENLRWAEERLSEAQRIGQVGNWDWDVRKDSMWWSEEANRLFNAEPGTFLSNKGTLLTRVHPEDRESFEHALREALAGNERLALDHRIVRPDGSVRVVHQQAEVSFDEFQRPLRVAGTVNDVTDRRKAEDDIRRRAGFQTLLAELSFELIRARAGDFARRLESGLAMVGDRYDIDEVVVLWPVTDDGGLTPLNRWSRSGGNIQVDKHPWLKQRILCGETVLVATPDELANAAEDDHRAFEQDGRKSLLAVPLSVDNKLVGSMLFSTVRSAREWPEHTIDELRLIAANVTNAIARSRASAEIRRLKNLLQEENVFLREEVRLAHGFDEIVGESENLKSCLRAVEKVAPTDVPVLILGETGTGKELVARAVYRLSKRCDGPFISVNCPTLPANLIESELFGHEKGAFTGALSRRKGRFELANGGTMFLDEIGDLPLELQAKLLRVLQTGHFERLGGSETLFSDVRLIAATNRDLRRAVDAGEFRADLLYRIQTFPIHLPPLRARKEDIPLLARHFVEKHAKQLGKHFDTISAQTLRELEAYSWPGNIRELESLIERAMITMESNSVLTLSPPVETDGRVLPASAATVDLSEFERAHIVRVLEKTNWKISGSNGAASVLGIPASTLRSKMKAHRIVREVG